jgi:multicomponent Na+:H+ antiporter subunit E
MNRERLAADAVLVVWLAIVWTALWGEPQLGTAVAGVLLGALVVLALRGEGPQKLGQVRPLAAVRYAFAFLAMLLKATAEVVVAVLAPRGRIAPAVVPVHLPPATPIIITMVANSVTLTPGTITVDAVRNEDGSADLLVHALNAADPEAIVSDTLRIYELATGAFGARDRGRDGARGMGGSA